ncbi:hypothetical protein ACDQ58_11125 [Fusobacterium animalis]|uniref:hypothetical protein n=1 Tax=Fusobacterium animalis TaxID=76859 RepID=UPI003558B34A
MENSVSSVPTSQYKRWFAIKLFEGDKKATEKLNLSSDEKNKVDSIIKEATTKFDDDGEGIITDARYEYISKIISQTVKKGRSGLTMSDRADRILTNRIFALPIFVLVMFLIYYISVTVVGGPVTDWVNDTFFTDIIGGSVSSMLESIKVAPWLSSLIVDGIIGGVGAVLGFTPLIATLYLFIAILEDIG